MMSRRVVVQRWPAVPTAPKTAPRIAILRSASLEMMIALFPPSSSKARPSLAPRAAPTALPMRVDPVAETSGILVSAAIHPPVSRPPVTRQETPSGTLLDLKTSATICWQAIPQSGVFSDGFQTHTFPQTQLNIAFQLQTATG